MQNERNGECLPVQNMIQINGSCTAGGDSGGPVFTADLTGAVGVHSGGICGSFSIAEPLRRMHEYWGLLPYAD